MCMIMMQLNVVDGQTSVLTSGPHVLLRALRVKI